MIRHFHDRNRWYRTKRSQDFNVRLGDGKDGNCLNLTAFRVDVVVGMAELQKPVCFEVAFRTQYSFQELTSDKKFDVLEIVTTDICDDFLFKGKWDLAFVKECRFRSISDIFQPLSEIQSREVASLGYLYSDPIKMPSDRWQCTLVSATNEGSVLLFEGRPKVKTAV